MKPPRKKPFPNCNTLTTNVLHLPPNLDRLIDERWNRENSLKVDRWIWHAEAEGARV